MNTFNDYTLNLPFIEKIKLDRILKIIQLEKTTDLNIINNALQIINNIYIQEDTNIKDKLVYRVLRQYGSNKDYYHVCNIEVGEYYKLLDTNRQFYSSYNKNKELYFDSIFNLLLFKYYTDDNVYQITINDYNFISSILCINTPNKYIDFLDDVLKDSKTLENLDNNIKEIIFDYNKP